MHITEGISWVLPTVMSNKVCCEMPTPPLCCDTASCQKILKSLHELGDGSCNYLSYCLAAAALPHCCWPPLRLLLHLFALSLATRAQSPWWARGRPGPLTAAGQEACSSWLCRHPGAIPRRSCVSLGPAPSLVLYRSARLQGTLDQWMAQGEASTHAQAHTPNAAFCVCARGFFPLPCWLWVS